MSVETAELRQEILIVEDDAVVREAMGDLFRSVGYSVLEFESSEDLLCQLDTTVAGCIVADVRMRGMTGIDLQERLLQDNAEIPLILVTAYPKTRLTVRALHLGAVTFL